MNLSIVYRVFAPNILVGWFPCIDTSRTHAVPTDMQEQIASVEDVTLTWPRAAAAAQLLIEHESPVGAGREGVREWCKSCKAQLAELMEQRAEADE